MSDDFEKIYNSNIAYVWNCLLRLGVAARDVEDKAHDVFVVFYKRRADFDQAKPVRPWLGGIAVRVASDYRKKGQNRNEQLLEEGKEIERSAIAETNKEQRDAHETVMAGLKKLDMDKRVVLVLHDIEGHSAPEIAQMLGIPINTVYSRLRHARERFESVVGRLGLRGGVE